ncbi:MAG TPA: DNA internalization-related competence protein ComEC/Rec2 [Rhodocyclaceae bacterium]|jgi:competence protein ComEC|nr:DNA internalization-related competence protein ComEC/Rec2 [Rhodocyclaceae bacterium]
MIAIALGFLMGLVWLHHQALLPAHAGEISIGAICLIFVACRVRGWVRSCMLFACACLAGVTWAGWLAQMRLADVLPAALEGEDIVLVGTVADMPQKIDRGWRFDFDVDSVASGSSHVPRHVSLAWYEHGFRDEQNASVPPLHAGERWQFTVRLKRPHGNLNPYGFDYEGWLFQRGIRATGYVRANADAVQLAPSSGHWVERARQEIRQRFERTLPDSPYAGVLVALAIGDQQAVPRNQWDVFARTGITHLISISGLHVTLLAGLVHALVSFLWRRSRYLMLYLPAQRAAVFIGFLAALFYCLLAGFAVPAQRTLYMLAVVAVALWSKRNIAPRHALTLALLLVMVADPWCVLAPGFWLSFGAVALLFYIGSGRIGDAHWLRQWGRSQWAMSIGLLPALLLLFHQFSLVSPLANAVAIPVVSFAITPLVLLAAVPGLTFLLQPAHALVSLLMRFIDALAALPWGVWQQAEAPFALTVLAMLGVLWLLLPRGLPSRWLGTIPLAALLVWLPLRPAEGEMHVTTLDVGQGLAVHVQTATHDLLFDTGPAYSEESDSGTRIILPYLRASGVSALDTLVVSHADSDHSGGAESVVDGVHVGELLTSVPFENRLAALPVTQRACIAGDAWEWDGVNFAVLHPAVGDYDKMNAKTNNMSCVLKLVSRHGSMLLSSDIEARDEAKLLAENADALKSDVLLVPHHGSKTSSTPQFVAAVDAAHVIVPVGHRNRYRHPHPDVMARYVSTKIYRTDRNGALTVRYSDDGIDVADARSANGRYWHASD